MRPDYTLTDRDFINPDTIDLYGNTNAHLLPASPKAFVLEFPGLGGGSCLGGCMDMGPYNGPLSGFLAERGILQVYTFPGPWSWMNRGAVRMVNALVDAIREKYGFTEKTPWAVMGGSMGGAGALIYTAGGDPAYTPTACIAHCPCVDVLDRVYCKENIPRTFFRAVADYEMPIAEALKTLSPIHRMDDKPFIPYHIINDLADALFPPEQMDAYVEALRGMGHDVTYHRLENCGHGELTGEEWEVIRAFLLGHLVK
jgi:pimeloyl-ACP methyl ester carboxylesterase